MSTYVGDLIDGGTHHFAFTTVGRDGEPFTLIGGVVSVYKAANVTETTAGVTTVLDFDGHTGMNMVTLVLTDGFYVPDTDYHIVVTTGTIDGVDIAGYVVGCFSISNRMPNVNVTQINDDTVPAVNLAKSALGIVPGAAVGTPTTTVIDTDLTEATTDHYKGRILTFTGGAVAGQSTDITGYNGTTKELTVTALTNAPAAADPFVIT